MSFLVIFIGIILLLFVMAFLSKRRFGVLGLGLVAGAYVSSLWLADLTPLVADAGLRLVQPPLESVVAAALILLPAMLLLLSGPSYATRIPRLLGALLFAALAAVLLLEPLSAALIIEGPGVVVYDGLVQYKEAIITSFLVIALGDIITTKTPKIPKKH